MVQKHGGTNSQVVRTKEEAEELWSDRKNAGGRRMLVSYAE
jgi:hypothetical protein